MDTVDRRTRGGNGNAEGGGIAPLDVDDDGGSTLVVVLGMIGNGRTNGGGGGGRDAFECTGVDARVVSNALECTGVVARDSPSGSTICVSMSLFSVSMTVVASVIIVVVVAMTPTAAASVLPSFCGDVNSVLIISPTNALPSLDSRVAREGGEAVGARISEEGEEGPWVVATDKPAKSPPPPSLAGTVEEGGGASMLLTLSTTSSHFTTTTSSPPALFPPSSLFIANG